MERQTAVSVSSGIVVWNGPDSLTQPAESVLYAAPLDGSAHPGVVAHGAFHAASDDRVYYVEAPPTAWPVTSRSGNWG